MTRERERAGGRRKEKRKRKRRGMGEKRRERDREREKTNHVDWDELLQGAADQAQLDNVPGLGGDHQA